MNYSLKDMMLKDQTKQLLLHQGNYESVFYFSPQFQTLFFSSIWFPFSCLYSYQINFRRTYQDNRKAQLLTVLWGIEFPG